MTENEPIHKPYCVIYKDHNGFYYTEMYYANDPEQALTIAEEAFYDEYDDEDDQFIWIHVYECRSVMVNSID